MGSGGNKQLGRPLEASRRIIIFTLKCFPVQPDAPKDSAEYLNTFREEWREVFILSAEIYIFGALMYIILASGVKQPWADGVTNRTVTLTDSVSEVDVAGDNKRFGRATTIQNSKEGVNA